MAKPAVNPANTERKFNETLSAIWQTKGGNFMSMAVDARVFDALKKVEIGGKLTVKIVPAERRKSDTSPHAYIEYISKEDVDAFNKNKAQDPI